IERMNGEIDSAVAGETVGLALVAALAARTQLAITEHQNIEIEDALWPERVVGDVTQPRLPLVRPSHAEGPLGQADGRAFRIEDAQFPEMQAARLFDDRHVRPQRPIALQRLRHVVDFDADVM